MKNMHCFLLSLIWNFPLCGFCAFVGTYAPYYAPIIKLITISTHTTHSSTACSFVLIQSRGLGDASDFFQFHTGNGSCHVGTVDRHSLEIQPSLGLVQVFVQGKISLNMNAMLWMSRCLPFFQY